MMVSTRRLVAVVSLALVSALVGACRRDHVVAGLAPPPSALAESDAAPATSSVIATREPWPQALAAPDDALELDRLADAEGCAGLLVGLEEGGAVGRTALRALPFADDAELAMGRLAEIARQADDAALPLVLDAIEGIAQRPLHQREPLDPLGTHAAFDALVEIAKRDRTPPPWRAQAVTTARLIAQRGPYDAALLPTDFDRP